MTEQINSITNLTDTNKTIEELLSEGYQGVNYELIDNEGFVATANHFADKIQWLKTSPDEDGDIGLMTLDVQAFDELLEFMLDKFGWCPMVYSNTSASEIHIFTPQNELEEMAIELTTEGDYGWKGSLYRLAYVEKYQDKIGLIFATKPEDSEQQDWLLVQIDQKNKERSWSVHDGSLEQVYYIMAEEIEIPEPNYKPTPEQIAEAIKGLSTKEDNLIEFETTGMITAEKAIELLKDYIQAEEENEEEKCEAYSSRLFAQKKANNLKIHVDDEYLDFPEYFNELIDLLDLEEATKLHVKIAKELVSNDFEGLYGHEFDCSSYAISEIEPLVKLWHLTQDLVGEEHIIIDENDTSAHEAIELTIIAIGAFNYALCEGAERFFREDLLRSIVGTIFGRWLCGYDELVGTFDVVNCILFLKYKDWLEAIIFNLDYAVPYLNLSVYELRDIIECAVRNECSTDEMLSFILHLLTCHNCQDIVILCNYVFYHRSGYDSEVEEWTVEDEDWHNWDDSGFVDTMIEMVDSWTDSKRIELLQEIIEHPNITQKMLEKLTDSEYEEVAEFAKEKLQELE